MGRIIAVVVGILTVWEALAQIMPDVFQVRRDSKLKQLLWSSKSIWVAAIPIGCLISWYIWTLEGRLDALNSTLTTISHVSSIDDTGLRFAAWGPLLDGSGCMAVIDASKLPTTLRNKFEIVLVCGFSDPAIDRFKDTRITLSQLFTPQDALSISMPFSRIMADSLANNQEATIKKLQPRPARGTKIVLMDIIWERVLLLPKGFDITNIHKLADVTLSGGKIASPEVSVEAFKQVTAK